MPAITPKEVKDIIAQPVPEFVFKYMNELIVQNYSCGEAQVQQYELIDLIQSRRPELYGVRLQWLESLVEYYREAGWQVTYRECIKRDDPPTYYIFKAHFLKTVK